MRVEVGRAGPQGASWDGAGVNFAVYSAIATRVEVCVYDARQRALARFDLPGKTGHIWHGHVPDLKPGARYGLRIHGPWQPAHGHRCDAHKLLIDPYAKALAGEVRWHSSLTDHGRDSAAYVPLAVVVDDHFDWGEDRPLHTPWQQSVIYELHVRGFTKQLESVPAALRGTYAGLAHEASIAHLRKLGVTAVELLPVHAFVNDAFLCERGLTNYWGYSTLAFLAPASRYAYQPSAVVDEFKAMVRALHRAGIEVILDVVYNHTCEGNERGPTLSLKGIDNASYYRLDSEGKYRDVTGCGNSVDASSPAAAQLILDSLRYWVREMHVDGFRFDLATTLGRNAEGDFDGAFLHTIARDPLLSRVKLIAEPWDLGPDSYQLGNFPPPMHEWNGKYRDAVRRYWRGDGELAAYELERSINYVTCHDGFCLRDLVSYAQKHNEANGEGNRDGSDHDHPWNSGVEGETTRPDVLRLRARQQRNLLATLLLSRGVPMLLAGDELGRTQHGNNNPYCQDNELSWLDWANIDEGLLTFTRRLLRLRRTLKFEHVRWRDDAFTTDDLLVLLNPSAKARSCELPPGEWKLVLDTAGVRSIEGAHYRLTNRSLAVFRSLQPRGSASRDAAERPQH